MEISFNPFCSDITIRDINVHGGYDSILRKNFEISFFT